MGKRKKKAVKKIPKPSAPESPKTGQVHGPTEEENDGTLGWGILPSRDLKKNLGCG